jgi:hypothetical protein
VVDEALVARTRPLSSNLDDLRIFDGDWRCGDALIFRDFNNVLNTAYKRERGRFLSQFTLHSKLETPSQRFVAAVFVIRGHFSWSQGSLAGARVAFPRFALLEWHMLQASSRQCLDLRANRQGKKLQMRFLESSSRAACIPAVMGTK